MLVPRGDFMGEVHSGLKLLVDESGKSIRQVARDIEYRFETIRKMYNDELRHYPSDLLAKLCDYFECGIEEILIYEKEPPQD